MIKIAYDLNNFIVLAARMPQIWKNYQVQSQRQLGNVQRLSTLVRGVLIGEDTEHWSRMCRVRAQVS